MHVFLIFLVLSVFIQMAMFIPAFLKKTDKLTDMSYALTFILLVLAGIPCLRGNAVRLFAAFMVTAWGIRLGIFLIIRINKAGGDSRFDGIREDFGRFIRFWILQGVTVWILMLPFFFLLAEGSRPLFTALSLPGAAIWIAGFLIESAADAQKFRFRSDNANKGRWIERGLWAYSRHPNYFGEILCWWGLWLFVFPHLAPFARMISLAGPLFITALLLFITGLPILEKQADARWGTEKDYMAYKKRTSVLIPFFRKKSKDE